MLLYPVYKILLLKESTFSVALRLMKAHSKIILWSSGIFIKISGKEHLKTSQPNIICANHTSFVDIFCLYAFIKDYFTFTGKKEIEKWPLFKVFYTSGMNILVDRQNKKGDIKAFKRMINVIDKGHSLFIFPEGTISKKVPELTDFKAGVVSLAIKKQIPILPITFTTNWKRLQRKGFFTGIAGPGLAKVIVHSPISTSGLTKADIPNLQEKLKSVINEPLNKAYGV